MNEWLEGDDYVSLGAFERFYPLPDGRPVEVWRKFFNVTRTIEWHDEVVVHSTVGSHGYGGEESELLVVRWLVSLLFSSVCRSLV